MALNFRAKLGKSYVRILFGNRNAGVRVGGNRTMAREQSAGSGPQIGKASENAALKTWLAAPTVESRRFVPPCDNAYTHKNKT